VTTTSRTTTTSVMTTTVVITNTDDDVTHTHTHGRCKSQGEDFSTLKNERKYKNEKINVNIWKHAKVERGARIVLR
jgi:hypothetical protein